MKSKRATEAARALWARLLDDGAYPIEAQTAELLEDFQSISIRDRLIADIPAVDEPLAQILFARTQGGPHRSRMDRAEQLLVHLYTHSRQFAVAPVLTVMAILSWWEGKASKARQFAELALESNPGYALAVLIKDVIAAGVLAGWATGKTTSHGSR